MHPFNTKTGNFVDVLPSQSISQSASTELSCLHQPHTDKFV